jgi:hypothetical protein
MYRFRSVYETTITKATKKKKALQLPMGWGCRCFSGGAAMAVGRHANAMGPMNNLMTGRMLNFACNRQTSLIKACAFKHTWHRRTPPEFMISAYPLSVATTNRDTRALPR